MLEEGKMGKCKDLSNFQWGQFVIGRQLAGLKLPLTSEDGVWIPHLSERW